MIDSKLLALAYNKNVPADVQKAGKDHLANLQAIDKADDQITKARAAKSDAQAAAEISEQTLTDLLATWDPSAAAAATVVK